jgi:hypothetical protein
VVDLVADAFKYPMSVSTRIVYLKAQISEPNLIQLFEHDFSGRLFLAYHEHRAVVRKRISNDVRDRLRPARSRRAMNDHTWSRS